MSQQQVGFFAVLIATMTAALSADQPLFEKTHEAAQQQAKLDARVAELIEQLGSPEFPIREEAMRELTQIGLPAFDALQHAQSHRDLEIGLRARYLVASARVGWARDDDPPEVKMILKDYGQQPDGERTTRIDRLARLDNRQGWPALCRLARYERDEKLSKGAALAIITQEPPDAAQAEEAIKALQLGAGESRRRAAQWLRSYAHFLNEPETAVLEWNRQIDEEFELLAEKEKTSHEVVTALARWHAATLHQLGHEQETKAVVKKLSSILDGGPAAVLEHVDWLGHKEMWRYILEARENFAAAFDEDAMLLYRLAEAQEKLDDKAAAATAEQALALDAEGSAGHLKAALKLAERGLFDWSEAEYRSILKREDLATIHNLQARFLLSEMLHDRERDREAAEALEPIAAALGGTDPGPLGKRQNPLRQVIESLGREPGSMLSRMHYFFALDHLQRNEVPQAAARLAKGVKEDPQDADVLIGLHRLPDRSPEEQRETARYIREATTAFEEQIAEYSTNLGQLQGQLPNSDLAAFRRQLAMAHNQFAWLAANTGGDSEAAVNSSHESLKLRPGEAAYLDTLGRCYYANGDLLNAIKYQSEAVRKDPHAGQMQRQLAFFKAEAAKKK